MIHKGIMLLLVLMFLLPGTVLAAREDYRHIVNTPERFVLQSGTFESGDNEGTRMTRHPYNNGLDIDNSYNGPKVIELVAKRQGVQIKDLIEFFNSNVAQGALVGNAKTPVSAEGKLRAFKNLLMTAGTLIEIGDSVGACQQLNPSSAV